jgi:hypothetical protein
MKTTLQHHMNPLHVYCRLREIGIPKKVASPVCFYYEHTIFRFLIMPLLTKTYSMLDPVMPWRNHWA